MTRALSFIAALAVAAPASAATYAGKPAQPASETRVIARSIVWNLAGDTYRGRTDESRTAGGRCRARRGEITARERQRAFALLARADSPPSRAGQFALATWLALTPH